MSFSTDIYIYIYVYIERAERVEDISGKRMQDNERKSCCTVRKKEGWAQTDRRRKGRKTKKGRKYTTNKVGRFQQAGQAYVHCKSYFYK